MRKNDPGRFAGRPGSHYSRSMEIMTQSVRNLVSFLFRSGDIDNRIPAADADAMKKGAEAHRRLQKAAGGDYRAEVTLSMEYLFEKDDAVLKLQGRADGVFTDGIRTVDEIKTTFRRLSAFKEAAPEHLAQGRFYVYMLMLAEDLDEAGLRMTYFNLDTEETLYFRETWKKDDLFSWIGQVLGEYRAWVVLEKIHREERQASIHSMAFPYEYREGQKELAENVYRTIYHGRKLFLNAPTGTGKTIAAVFPALKAMGENKTDRLFYLTARTVTAQVALETAALLREKQALKCRTVMITARDRICPLGRPECNPEACPRAKGHFDRINGAIYELLTTTDEYSRETIEEAAEKHSVCPFEFGLDLSLFADMIICDYNYVFDPHVYLRRFFGEGSEKTQAVFLIDEAHNLLERGREMYSAELTREEIREFRNRVRDVYPGLEKELSGINKEMLRLRREARESSENGKGPVVRSREDVRTLTEKLLSLETLLSRILESQRKKNRKQDAEEAERAASGNTQEDGKKKYSLEEEKRQLSEEILEFYFRILHFNIIADLWDEDHYVIYTREGAKGELSVRFFCVDPSANLRNCMDRGRSAILFSATLLPIQYFKSLLGGTEQDYEIYAHSVFDPERLGLFIAQDVTSRYTRRSDSEYRRIAGGIRQVLEQRDGNYLVFFPSYAFMDHILDAGGFRADGFREEGEENGADPGRWKILIQRPNMNEAERSAFLKAFESPEDDRILAGFCVLGGIFSEGIDLVQDRLIGVVVVGTGIPQISEERDLLMTHFDAVSGNGFDYAYRYPGMNKVLQAAGRVIRTKDDIGIVALFDERFTEASYRRLFPAEWKHVETEPAGRLARRIERFWDSWL